MRKQKVFTDKRERHNCLQATDFSLKGFLASVFALFYSAIHTRKHIFVCTKN